MVIYSGFSHEKWWFSIAMLNYQRVMVICNFKQVFQHVGCVQGFGSSTARVSMARALSETRCTSPGWSECLVSWLKRCLWTSWVTIPWRQNCCNLRWMWTWPSMRRCWTSFFFLVVGGEQRWPIQPGDVVWIWVNLIFFWGTHGQPNHPQQPWLSMDPGQLSVGIRWFKWFSEIGHAFSWVIYAIRIALHDLNDHHRSKILANLEVK